MKTLTPNWSEGSLTFTETEEFQLKGNTWYNGTISGDQGSATEITLRAKVGDASYKPYDDSDGTDAQHLLFLTPPSGICQMYLPSAADTSIVLTLAETQKP